MRRHASRAELRSARFLPRTADGRSRAGADVIPIGGTFRLFSDQSPPSGRHGST